MENRADRSRLSVVGADSFFEARDFVNFQRSGEGRESVRKSPFLVVY